MNLTLRVWRQKDVRHRGNFQTYTATDVSLDMSFLEMLDAVNEDLILKGEDPIAFDHDCREGICGTCGVVIDGHPHGPSPATTTCQLHMRLFKNGDTITIEPWRARSFPDHQRPRGRSSTAGPDYRGRRLHFGVDGQCAGSQRHTDSEGNGRDGYGRRVVHRLRRLRGGLSQCLGDAVHRSKSGSPRATAAGPARTPRPRAEHGDCDGRRDVRSVHEYRRVRGRLPEGDLHRVDRSDEPRPCRSNYSLPPREWIEVPEYAGGFASFVSCPP